MYLDLYFAAMEDVFRQIRETQRDAIEKAAEAVAQSLSQGGALCVMDTGHMLRHEAFMRAGGLMAISPFSYEMNVDNPIRQRKDEKMPEDEQDAIEARTVAVALDRSKLRKGDVLIINSNSGRTRNVIETGLQCRDRGIVTIGISSRRQLDNCPAQHGSGKKLFDVVDIAVDTCGPHGDAVVEVKDNEKMCPASGMASTFALWAIQAEAVERLQARDVNPSIFRSVHVSGLEYVHEKHMAFIERGI